MPDFIYIWLVLNSKIILMKLKFIVLIPFFLFISVQCFSQIKFENGYFIDESGKTTTCLIKNVDWHDNPVKFEYKFSENGETQIATIENTQEFGIDNESKFIRAKVQIDKSSDIAANMSHTRNPEFVEETLFLKAEVEGDINFYSYKNGNLRRYFYKEESGKITQLIYKRYLYKPTKIAENNTYRQQLLGHLKCSSISEKDIKKVSYQTEPLKEIFASYNICKSDEMVQKTEKPKGDYNLTIRPGIIYSKLGQSTITYLDTEFKYGNRTNFRFGIELEYILPFNKNKWGIFAELAYWNNNSKSKAESDHVSGGFLVANYKNTVIELPLGFRYYFFLNEKSKLFLSTMYTFYYVKSEEEYSRIDNTTLYHEEDSGVTASNIGFGAGYKFNDRFVIEGRFLTFSGFGSLNFKYPTYTLSVGYSIF